MSQTARDSGERAPRSPWQDPFVERLIGRVRRDCYDLFIVLNEGHLRRNLPLYFEYYDRSRTHLSLAMDCPESTAPLALPLPLTPTTAVPLQLLRCRMNTSWGGKFPRRLPARETQNDQ